ncbi:endoribonuclease SymE [Kosakonia oryzendophytica]|uniref:endoribonuclease SymE n=1 Tax=Kosakonia oryzendophytica TaxID=1005665 RepID=UPI003D330754
MSRLSVAIQTHHKPETGTPTTRRYTVGYVSDAKYQPVPAVTLKGHWLTEAGFETGTPLEVRVMPGCLILTAQEPQSATEPEVVVALRKACKKLSARKQRQIAEFIQVITTPQKRADRLD